MNSQRYVHWKQIGEGAYGTVYAAYDCRKNQRVAIKQVSLPATAEKQGAVLLNRLSHPGCPKMLDYFENDTYGYFVMTFLSGENLVHHNLSSEQAKQLAREMIEIMEQMQRLEITYNDFKPANILYDGQRFYLVDYGSMMLHQSLETRFGSRAFASPEYLSGAKIDWRSDLYNLAKTIDHLVIHPNLVLSVWLKKSLQKDPRHRFKTLSQAKKWLDISIKPVLCSGIVIFLLGIGYFLGKDFYYQRALARGDYETCVQIMPSRKEAFEAYLSSHDPLSYQTWIILWQWQLPDVLDEPFLWQCVNQLSLLKHRFAWQLQKEILMRLSGDRADMYLSLLVEDNHLSQFSNWAKTNEDRLYLYRCCLYQKNSTFSTIYEDFKSCLEEDELINKNDKLHFLVEGALLAMDDVCLKELFFNLPEVDEFLDEKVKIAWMLFELGHYQEGWLHQAINLLEKNAQTPLYDEIFKKIEQWGSLA